MDTINLFTEPISAITHALWMAFNMFWEILWALILGFTLSAIIQAVVSKSEMVRLMPDDATGSIARACGLGAASSSCSYAAVAIARSIVRKGGNFTAAMVFQFASTNLVIELGILLALLMGWQFTLAEFIGGCLMIAILVWLFRLFLKPKLVQKAVRQAEQGLQGRMEGHADMDMSVTEGSLWQRLFSRPGFTAISQYFVMDWASVWQDILLGLLIAGALDVWVPKDFWKAFFLSDHPVLAAIWGPIVGPIVAIASFVCSIGNVPLAAVLWSGGISFGGVVAFIFADLIVLPILDIYRKYYGMKMSVFLLATFYAAIASAAFIIELLFQTLHLIPSQRNAQVLETSIHFNYTTVLNILFLIWTAILLQRFLQTGGLDMLRMMSHPKRAMAHSHHHHRDQM